MTMFWLVPATSGVGSPDTWVALAQLPDVIVLVLYRMSYVVAVPLLPLSPGAVQLSVMLLLVGLPVARLDTAAGATESTVCALGTFDRPDQFGTSSAVSMAK